eukprot:365593-Chlamydomonas_euryale.AAC.1
MTRETPDALTRAIPNCHTSPGTSNENVYVVQSRERPRQCTHVGCCCWAAGMHGGDGADES